MKLAEYVWPKLEQSVSEFSKKSLSSNPNLNWLHTSIKNMFYFKYSRVLLVLPYVRVPDYQNCSITILIPALHCLFFKLSFVMHYILLLQYGGR